MMRHHLTLLLAAAGALATAPAVAEESCAARVESLRGLLDAAAEEAISASTAGQGVAAARETQAREEGIDEEVPVVPYQEEDEEEEAVEEAEDAGEGGSRVMQAIALVDQAGAAAEEGDEAACLDSVAEAEALLDEEALEHEVEEDEGEEPSGEDEGASREEGEGEGASGEDDDASGEED